MEGATTASEAPLHAWSAQAPAFQQFLPATVGKQTNMSILVMMFRNFQTQQRGFVLFLILEIIRDVLALADRLLWPAAWVSSKGKEAGKGSGFTIVSFQPSHQHAVVRTWVDGMNQTITVSGQPVYTWPLMWLMFKTEAFKSTQQNGDMRDIKAHWMRPRSHFFVALSSDGEVIGCVACKEGDTSEWKEEEIGCKRCRLTHLSVAADWRKAGVGRALQAAVCAWAQNQHMREVVCMTANVVAAKFYKKCGFEVTDMVPLGGSGTTLSFLRQKL